MSMWRAGGCLRTVHQSLCPSTRLLRLGQTSRSSWIGENVHERLTVEGRVGWLDGDLLHCRDRCLSEQLAALDEYSTLKAMEIYGRGEKPGAAMLLSHAMMSFVRSFVLKRGFLGGVPGLIVALEQASDTFYKYAKCWEMHHSPKLEEVGDRDTSGVTDFRRPHDLVVPPDPDQRVARR
jgi:hypothetical protein